MHTLHCPMQCTHTPLSHAVYTLHCPMQYTHSTVPCSVHTPLSHAVHTLHCPMQCTHLDCATTSKLLYLILYLCCANGMTKEGISAVLYTEVEACVPLQFIPIHSQLLQISTHQVPFCNMMQHSLNYKFSCTRHECTYVHMKA
jgi:hypothetical protein